jgi:hypothetical protein|tara:strand:+ start:3311 stop:3859 length:549 start_codon:yes stop_codon:yes gene_type:complete
MPTLLKEDLKNILDLFKKNKSDYPYFVETGTYMGETILRFIDDFEKSYTIELSENFFNQFNEKDYNRDKLKSILGDSSKKLKEVIDEIYGNTIFFLDGHFSQCGTAKGEKDVPLFEELEILNNFFKYECLIIIDDLRLFGTNTGEDWTSVSKENLLKILENRIDSYFELNDRFIIQIKNSKN